MVLVNKTFFIILLYSYDQIFCSSVLKIDSGTVLWKNKQTKPSYSNETKLPERKSTTPKGKVLYKTTTNNKRDDVMNLDTEEFLNLIKNDNSEYVDKIIRSPKLRIQNIIIQLEDQLEKESKALRLLSRDNQKDNSLKNIRGQKGGILSVESYPFMSSIQIFDECSCAGAIIHRNVIIVAASCLKQFNSKRKIFKDIKVRVGSDFCDRDGQLVTVHRIYFHPLFDSQKLVNNLALIQVNRDLLSNPNDKIMMILAEYNSDKLIKDGTITLLGWGAKEKQTKNNALAKRLTKTVQTLYDIEECQQIYKRITAKTFCGNSVSRQKNCNKGVGNPALANGKLVGIVSFGPKTCDVTSPPTVFTKLSSYKFWIDTMMSLATAELTRKVAQREGLSKLNNLNETNTQNKSINNKSITIKTLNKNEYMKKADKIFKKYRKVISDAYIDSRKQFAPFQEITPPFILQTNGGHYDRPKDGRGL